MTPKLWIYAAVGLLVVGMFLRLQFIESQLESARYTIKEYKQKSDEAKEDYKENLKIYTEQVIALDKQLRNELDKIDNFKEDVNETKCQNAVRFFNTFEY